MDGFIDLHTHILPGVDDGAQNMSEAMNLVRMAYMNGTRAMVLTPHYRGSYKKNSPAWLREVFSIFSQMVAQELPQMNLYLGNEIYYEQEAPANLQSKNILSINDTHYCLLEFSPGTLRSQILTGIVEMLRNGYTPIIAHVERYDAFAKLGDLVDEVLDLGALIQVNASSIMGKHGFRVKLLCNKLLKEQKVHFVATDAHDEQKRTPLLHECFLYVQKRYGEEYANKLFYDHAAAVLEDCVL